jgi:ABC-type transporter Mla subunit MlaD
VNNAENGVALNQEVLSNLEEINGQVGKVSEVIREIATGSEQQNQGIDQISSGVTQLNTLTQQNAASSEQSASAAEEMSSQAGNMQAMVAEYKLSTARKTSSPVAAEPARLSNGVHEKNGRKPAPAPQVLIPLGADDEDTMSEL